MKTARAIYSDASSFIRLVIQRELPGKDLTGIPIVVVARLLGLVIDALLLIVDRLDVLIQLQVGGAPPDKGEIS